ncbi:uncharacterized protein LOC134753459 [Cydia strobilella]|uniref:uncharacterized protein LOC134753459 n=1 Tax=Cydia strobilella TaxID=1100964 RepID=UPI003006924D
MEGKEQPGYLNVVKFQWFLEATRCASTAATPCVIARLPSEDTATTGIVGSVTCAATPTCTVRRCLEASFSVRAALDASSEVAHRPDEHGLRARSAVVGARPCTGLLSVLEHNLKPPPHKTTGLFLNSIVVLLSQRRRRRAPVHGVIERARAQSNTTTQSNITRKQVFPNSIVDLRALLIVPTYSCPVRTQRRGRRAPVHGVIERARAQSDTTSSQENSKTETAVPARDPRTCPDCYCVSDVVTQARRLINFIYYQTQNLIKSDTADIDQCTEMCQRMLADVKCPIPEPRSQAFPIPPRPDSLLRNSMPEKISSIDTGTSNSRSRFQSKRRNKKKMKKEKPCSDLRIAELGTSVEIANMALRKTSTKKVQSELKITENADEPEPETISMFTNVDSVTSHTSNEEYLDSECHDYRGSKELDRSIPDQILKYIVRHPCKFFKKKILERSSLISVIAGINNEKDYRSAYESLKMLFHDEVLDHQHNGYKKLYSTINKKNTPFKLGWLEADIPGDRKTSPCRHYHQCHSYRCMRKQVMRLAGPTKSTMDIFRTKLKKLVVPPFLKRISFQYNKAPAIVKPEVRIQSDNRLPKSSRTSKQSHEKRKHGSRLNMVFTQNVYH